MEHDQDLEIVITDELKQEKTIRLANRHFDQATGSLFFTIDGKPYKAHVSQLDNNAGQQAWQVSYAHKQNPITVHKLQEQSTIMPAVQAMSSHPQAQSTPQAALKSPLAGRVSKVLIQAAQRVKKGQPLLLIESMKMENEIGAPHDAFIKTIFIAEGNVVQQNQILIDFECERETDATAKNAYEQKAVQNR